MKKRSYLAETAVRAFKTNYLETDDSPFAAGGRVKDEKDDCADSERDENGNCVHDLYGPGEFGTAAAQKRKRQRGGVAQEAIRTFRRALRD